MKGSFWNTRPFFFREKGHSLFPRGSAQDLTSFFPRVSAQDLPFPPHSPQSDSPTTQILLPRSPPPPRPCPASASLKRCAVWQIPFVTSGAKVFKYLGIPEVVPARESLIRCGKRL